MTKSRRVARLPARDPASQWAERVLAGREVVGRLVRRAVERQEWDLAHGAERGLVFDPAAGLRVVEYFETFLHHWEGIFAGQPIRLEPWQRWKITTLYGWLRESGERRFLRSLEEESRKNGKSLEAAGRALFHLDADNEPAAACYIAATKREQAEIVWRSAARMVAANPLLARRIIRLKSTYRLVCEETASILQALGADGDTLDGLNPSFVVIDELHAHRTREVYDRMEAGQGSRRQPMLLVITTAGDETPDTPYEQLHNYAIHTVEGFDRGFVDDEQFVFIAALDDDDDPFDEDVWPKANPNLDVSVSRKFLRAQAAKARNDSAFLSTFLRWHCNRRAATVEHWITGAEWDACEDSALRSADLDGRVAYGGLDLSSTRDLSAFAAALPEDDGGAIVKAFAWCPGEALAVRAREDNARYVDWARDGWLVTTPGTAIDHHFVIDRIRAESSRFDLRQIGFDPALATFVSIELANAGFPMVAVPQGPVHLTEPLNRFEDLVRTRKLRHDGNPVLRWCIANVLIEDAGSNLRRLRKPKTRTRIDAATATLIAYSRLTKFRNDGPENSYLDFEAPAPAGGGAPVTSYGPDYFGGATP